MCDVDVNEYDQLAKKLRVARGMTIKEAALVFNVSCHAIRNWCYKGRIRYLMTPGGGIRIPVDVVDDYLDGKYVKENNGEFVQEKIESLEMRRQVALARLDALLAKGAKK